MINKSLCHYLVLVVQRKSTYKTVFWLPVKSEAE